jgi:hypothetical protein
MVNNLGERILVIHSFSRIFTLSYQIILGVAPLLVDALASIILALGCTGRILAVAHRQLGFHLLPTSSALRSPMLALGTASPSWSMSPSALQPGSSIISLRR